MCCPNVTLCVYLSLFKEHFLFFFSGLKLDQKVKIRVEPGLFEWTKWEANKAIPNFMTLTELTEASYKIDTSYR